MKKFYILAVIIILIFSYSALKAQLNGTYSIGAGRDYATIALANTALTTDGISGDVVFQIYDNFVITTTLNTGVTTNPGGGISGSPSYSITFEGVNPSSPAWLQSGLAKIWAINGISNLHFKNIKFESTITSSASASNILTFDRGTCENISITNCIFYRNPFSATNTTQLYSIFALASTQSGTGTRIKLNDILIENCEFTGGGKGIHLYGISAVPITGLVIKNNTFYDQCYSAIEHEYVTDFTVEGNQTGKINTNDFYSTSTTTAKYFMNFSNCNNLNVIKNRIVADNINQNNTSTFIGMRFANCGTSTACLVSNNIIMMAGILPSGDRTAGGIYLESTCRNIKIIHNTVSIRPSVGVVRTNAVFAFRSAVTTSTPNVIQNNIFETFSETLSETFPYGNAIDIVANAGTTCNNNIYYSSKSDGLRLNTTYYSDIPSFIGRVSGGSDNNSMLINPKLLSDFTPSEPSVNNKGVYRSEVIDDINNITRNISTPDPGAIEWDVPLNDCGIIEILPLCDADKKLTVKVFNYGINTINSFNINYTVNDGAVHTIPYTSFNISPNAESAYIEIIDPAITAIAPGATYTLKVYTTFPNGFADEQPVNDTMTLTSRNRLSGIYKTGDVGDPFASPADAADALYAAGICGSVVIDIRSGSYDGQVHIQRIEGTSAVNTVTFKSETNNMADVIIDRYTSIRGGDANDMSTVLIDSVSYVTIKHVTIRATIADGTTQGSYIYRTNPVMFYAPVGSGGTSNTGNCDYITIDSCHIIAPPTTTSASAIRAIAAYHATNHNITISNNIIQNGTHGIYYSSDMNQNYPTSNTAGTNLCSENIIIKNNTILNTYEGGIFIAYYIFNDLIIDGNTIIGNSTYAYRGIHMSNVYSIGTTSAPLNMNRKIINNHIEICGNGMSGIHLNGQQSGSGLINHATYPALIANNVIRINSTYTSSSYLNVVAGIYVASGNSYNNYINNTVFIESAAKESYAYFQYRGNNYSVIRNNIFVNISATGYAAGFFGTDGSGSGTGIMNNLISLMDNNVYWSANVSGMGKLNGNLSGTSNFTDAVYDFAGWKTKLQGTYAGTDANSSLQFPSFVMPYTDFHLNSNITGTQIINVITDKDGKTRNNPPSAGAFEYDTDYIPNSSASSGSPISYPLLGPEDLTSPSTVTYKLPITDAGTVTWSYPAGWTVASGAGTTTITFNIPAGGNLSGNVCASLLYGSCFTIVACKTVSAEDEQPCNPPVISYTYPTGSVCDDNSNVDVNLVLTGDSDCADWEISWKDYNDKYYNGTTFGSSSEIFGNYMSMSIEKNQDYKVIARCTDNLTCISTIKTVRVNPDFYSPSAITASIGSPANGDIHSIYVSWSGAIGATAYELEYSSDNISWTPVSLFPSNATSATIALGDNPNKQYWFRVRAKSSAGATCTWTSTTLYTACDAPEIPIINNIECFSLDFSILSETPMPNPDYTKYSILLSDGTYVQADGTTGSTSFWQTRTEWGTTININELNKGTEYCFTVQAQNEDGHIVNGKSTSITNGVCTFESGAQNLSLNLMSMPPANAWSSPSTCTNGGGWRWGTDGQGNPNNYAYITNTMGWGCFFRTPTFNCSDMDYVTMTFDINNPVISASSHIYIGTLWHNVGSGAYIAVPVSINGGAWITAGTGARIYMDVARDWETITVVYDISGLTAAQKSSGLHFYVYSNTLNNVGTYNIKFDNFYMFAGTGATCVTTSSVSCEEDICAVPIVVTASTGTPANGTNHNIDLSWTEATGTGISYELEYSADNVSWTPIALTPPTSTTVSVDLGDNPNKQYWFRVRVKNTSGVTCSWETATQYTASDIPEAPIISSVECYSFSLTVNPETPTVNPGYTKYSILLSDGNYLQADGTSGATSVWQTRQEWGAATATAAFTINVNGLDKDTEYCFTVQARNENGNIVQNNSTPNMPMTNGVCDFENSTVYERPSSSPHTVTNKWILPIGALCPSGAWTIGTDGQGNPGNYAYITGSSGYFCYITTPKFDCTGLDYVTITFDIDNPIINDSWLAYIYPSGLSIGLDYYFPSISINGGPWEVIEPWGVPRIDMDIVRNWETITIVYDLTTIPEHLRNGLFFEFTANTGNTASNGTYIIKLDNFNVYAGASGGTSTGAATCVTTSSISCPDEVCSNSPTINLSVNNANTCSNTDYIIDGTFGGGATLVNVTHNGNGILDNTSATSSPFSLAYTPAASDEGNIVTISFETDNPDGEPCVAATASFDLIINVVPSVSMVETEVCQNDTVHLLFTGVAPFELNYTFNGTSQTITVYGMDTVLVATQAGENEFIVHSLMSGNGCYSGNLDGGVLINGVFWAKSNVDAPGTFAANPEDFGMFYQWNRPIGWSSTDPIINHLGETTLDNYRNPDIDWECYPLGFSWEISNNVCPEGWRLPSEYEFNSLLVEGTNKYWGQLNGVNGTFIGSGENIVFFPAVGIRNEYAELWQEINNNNNYWGKKSCSYYYEEELCECAEIFSFSFYVNDYEDYYDTVSSCSYSGGVGGGGAGTAWAFPVRCVKDAHVDTITVHTIKYNNITETICSTDSILFNGTYYKEEGIYTYTSQTTLGCDSIVTLNLTIENCACPNSPTINLSVNNANTCSNTDYIIDGTFGGSATLVNVTHNGNGILDNTSATSSPFNFAYTPAASDEGNIVTISFETDNPDGEPCVAATASFDLTINIVPAVSMVETEVCQNDTVHLQFTGVAPFELNYTFNGTSQTITVYGMDTVLVATQAGENLFVVNSLISANECIVGNSDGIAINGLIWATRNVDAPGDFVENPEDFGMLYQWNRPIGWSNTDPLINHLGGTVWDSSIPSGDTWEISNNICPTGWRVPKVEEVNSLISADSYWGNLNGVNGRFIGSGEQTIFLPAAGFRIDNGTINKVSQEGCYWSSTPDDDDSAHGLSFNENMYYHIATRISAYSVRCVRDAHVDTLTVNPTKYNNITETICSTDSILFNGTYYKEEGIYTYTSQTTLGCDSIITLNLSVENCEPQPTLQCFNDTLVREYCHNTSAVGQTVYVLNNDIVPCEKPVINVLYYTSRFSDVVVYNNADYIKYDFYYPGLGEYKDSLQYEVICGTEKDTAWFYIFKIEAEYPSIQTLTTSCNQIYIETENPLPVASTFLIIKEDNSFYDYLITYMTDTIKTATFTGLSDGKYYVQACHGQCCDYDSINVNSTIYNTINADICSADSILFNGTYYKEEGTYSYTSQATSGCDSIVTLNLSVNTFLARTVTTSICAGEKYNFYGTDYDDDVIGLEHRFTNTTGCDSIVTLNLTVNPILTRTITTSICSGETYNFYGTDYYYDVTDLEYRFTNTTGCDSIVTLNLTVKPLPNASITPDSGTLTCTTTSISVTASGGGAYLWSNGLGIDATANIISAGTYTVTVTGANGCTDTASIDINQTGDLPNVIITPNSGTLTCINTNIQVTASGGEAYLWSNGLGTDATVTITSAGTYTVTVTGANGCTDTGSITIDSNTTPPTASITPTSGTLTCTTTSISAEASGGGAYLWSNNLGTDATAIIISAGTYTVTVTNPANGCTNSTNINITQDNTQANVNILASNTELTCNITAITLTANGNNITNYQWSTAETGNTITVNTPNTYTVTAIAANGCNAISQITISQSLVTPYIYINANTNTVTCINTNINLSVNTDAASYIWNTGQTNTSINVNTAGTYSVMATAANGCTNSTSINITQDNAAPNIWLQNNTGTNILSCNNNSIEITATGGALYQWSGGNSPNTANNTFSEAGNYTITVTALNGCTSIQTVTIDENNSGVSAITAIMPLCSDDTPVQLETQITGGTWEGNGIVNNLSGVFNPYIAGAGTHRVTYSLHSGSCNIDSEIIIIVNPAIITVSETVSNAYCDEMRTGIDLSVEGGTPPYIYSWTNNQQTSPSANITILDIPAGLYVITITDNKGCTYKTEPLMVIQESGNCITIPNAFTPNGDGINDNWIIGHIDRFPDHIVQVFNRWGQKLYEGTFGSEPWNGKYKGKELPTGSYIYIVKLRRMGLEYTGIITVKR